MTYLNAGQIKERNTARMGETLGIVYTALQSELKWMYLKWGQYRELFGQKPERVDLLNAVAGSLFRVVQDVMWEDMVLGIARITDSPRTAGRENLTIRRLPELVMGTPIETRVGHEVTVVLEKAAFARDWRNRHLAHRDLLGAVDKEKAEPLAPASRLAVQEALDSIAGLLNTVDRHYLESEMAYELTSMLGDAVNLLRILRDGVEARDLHFEHLRTGSLSSEELVRWSREI